MSRKRTIKKTDALKEHGPSDAFYAIGPWGMSPVFRCTCGFETDAYSGDDWSEAGALFDDHLRGDFLEKN